MKYSDKLKDPRWQKKRLKILERDNFTCAYCGDDESTLNVHHKIYIANNDPWEYDNKVLITLCEKCHQKDHFYKSKVDDILHDMRISGLPNEQIALFLEQGFVKYNSNGFVESLCIDGLRNDLV